MNDIRIELTRLGLTVFRANVGKFKMADGRWFDTGLPKGFSDLFAIDDGKIYFIEVKVKPNKPTKEQVHFLSQMEIKGCKCGVAYSVQDAIKICTK